MGRAVAALNKLLKLVYSAKVIFAGVVAGQPLFLAHHLVLGVSIQSVNIVQKVVNKTTTLFIRLDNDGFGDLNIGCAFVFEELLVDVVVFR